jgi:chromosome segregation ATPase
MYTELEHSKEECCKLRDQLKQTENTEVLVDDLRIQLQRVKKERQEAKATCRALQDKLDSSEADKLRLSRRIERVKSERDQVNAERQRLEVQFAEQGQLVRTRSCHKLLFHTF